MSDEVVVYQLKMVGIGNRFKKRKKKWYYFKNPIGAKNGERA